jgi:hypothetical protein
MRVRARPTIYEINTAAWLDGSAASSDAPVGLGDPPGSGLECARDPADCRRFIFSTVLSLVIPALLTRTSRRLPVVLDQPF